MPESTATWTDRGVTARVAGTRFAEVRWFAAIDSTNRYLLDEARRGAPEGLVAVADDQSAGRGRLGRTWIAPPASSLLVSVLLRPVLAPEHWHLLTVAASLAAADALAAVAGVEARGKWPNDLLVGERKIAGLLAESLPSGAVVVGMGCNVHWASFPPEIAETATACNLESDAVPDRTELLVAWLDAYDARLGALDRPGGPAALRVEWEARSATLGRRVRVDLAREQVTGVAETLTDTGHLVVRADDGTAVEVAAGDVVHLRADP